MLRPLGQVQSLKEQKAKWRKTARVNYYQLRLLYQKGRPRWRLIYIKRKAILSFFSGYIGTWDKICELSKK